MCGDTGISSINLRGKMNKMHKIIPEKAVSGFTDQFKVSREGLMRRERKLNRRRVGSSEGKRGDNVFVLTVNGYCWTVKSWISSHLIILYSLIIISCLFMCTSMNYVYTHLILSLPSPSLPLSLSPSLPLSLSPSLPLSLSPSILSLAAK